MLLSLAFLCCWLVLTWRDARLGRASWWQLLAGTTVAGLWLRQFPRVWGDLGRRGDLRLMWLGCLPAAGDVENEQRAGWHVNVNGIRPVEVIPVLNIGPVLLLRLSAIRSASASPAWSEWVWLSDRQPMMDAVSLHHLRALVFVSGMNRRTGKGGIHSPYKASPTKVASCPTMSSRDNGSKRPSPQSRRV